MRENLPFAATQHTPLPSQAQESTAHTATAKGGACHTAAILPHRAAYVATAWRSARAWIGVANPGPLDTALDTLRAQFPELAENIDALELVAQRKASAYLDEPNASPSAFQAALARWQAAALDGLAALNHAQLETSPGHQLELEASNV